MYKENKRTRVSRSGEKRLVVRLVEGSLGWRELRLGKFGSEVRRDRQTGLLSGPPVDWVGKREIRR